MPVNFHDQLGEQMQIHEITHKRVDEAMLGVGAAIGRQISGALQRKAFGGVISPTGGATMDRAQAVQLGRQLSNTLTPVMMKQWAAAVQAAMARSKNPATGAPVTSASELSMDSKNALKAELDVMINQAIQPRSAYNYNDLIKSAGTDPVAQGRARATIDNISQAADQIFKATMDPAAGINTAQAWQSLMQDGVAPAQNMIAYDAGGRDDPDIRVKRGSVPTTFEIDVGNGTYVDFDKTNPTHAAIATKLGVEFK
jgi:hypothetical protein